MRSAEHRLIPGCWEQSSWHRREQPCAISNLHLSFAETTSSHQSLHQGLPENSAWIQLRYHTRNCSRVKEENFTKRLQQAEPAFLALRSKLHCKGSSDQSIFLWFSPVLPNTPTFLSPGRARQQLCDTSLCQLCSGTDCTETILAQRHLSCSLTHSPQLPPKLQAPKEPPNQHFKITGN